MNRRPTPDIDRIRAALAQRDLTDPAQGEHDFQDLVDRIHRTLAGRWDCARQLHRPCPLAAKPPVGPRAANAEPELHLRSSMAGNLPALIGSLAYSPPEDLLLILPGRVYGDEPHHELLLTRLVDTPLAPTAMADMARAVHQAVAAEVPYRLLSAGHEASERKLRMDLRNASVWEPVAVCEPLAPTRLAALGLGETEHHGVQMVVHLERLAQASGIATEGFQAIASGDELRRCARA